MDLLDDYKDEIELAKLMVVNNPEFQKLSYEDKINYTANLLLKLREKNKK